MKVENSSENTFEDMMKQITSSSAWKYLKGVEFKDIQFRDLSYKFPLMNWENKLKEKEWNELKPLLEMKYAWLSLVDNKKIIKNNFRSEITEFPVNITKQIVAVFTNIMHIHKVDPINKCVYLTELRYCKDQGFILKKNKIECINSLECDCSEFSTTRRAINGVKRFKNNSFCRHVFFISHFCLGKPQHEFTMDTCFDLQVPYANNLFQVEGHSVMQRKDVIDTPDKFEICGSCFNSVIKDHEYSGDICFRCNSHPIRILNHYISKLEFNKFPRDLVESCQFNDNKWKKWLKMHDDIEQYLYGGNLVLSFLDEMLSSDSTWSDVFNLFKGYSKLYECCVLFHGTTDNLKKDVLLAYKSIRCAFTSTDVISNLKVFDDSLALQFKNNCLLSFTQSNVSGDDNKIFISWNKNQQELQLDTLTNENEILMHHGTSRGYCLTWIEACTWDLKSLF
eukprot:NODE_30_length_32972_cov_0.541052.p8 type:complete len:451 gc:universal NODE_30_length_32972_cov_0.541052:20423-21775(+)